MLQRWQGLFWALLFAACLAQTPPSADYDSVNVIPSPVDGNVTVAWKQPALGTCTTVFAQKQYTGYITLPPGTSRLNAGNVTVNTFFWFIEARQLPESAPFTIFINGGPGSSSMVGLFQEVGPCQVVQLSKDRLGTVARDWGWDRSSNILFIDQPVQTGFSYDRPTNASLNLLDETLLYPPTTVPVAQPPYTFLNGTFSSNDPAATTNTSQLAAESIWHFLQAFLVSFPEYGRPVQPGIPLTAGVIDVHLFTESYGGRYGPAVGSFFEDQNLRRQSDPSFANVTIDLRLKSLGIINGWIDALVQSPTYPMFAYQNSYGIQAIDQVQQLNALSSFRGAGGCQELLTSCRAQELAYDRSSDGTEDVVNDACAAAAYSCQSNVYAPFLSSGRGVYDISQNALDAFPDSYYLEYLNTLDVQEAIGVPVNFTQSSLAVWHAFNETGDWARRSGIDDLVGLLNTGVRVALIYGDRDYVCNWIGGEAISFAVAGAAGQAYLPWYAAGYTPIVANISYIGGVVREFGNLSFSRIYDAGHLVPAYQPETMFTVFTRIISGTDISLGTVTDLSTYLSSGDANSTHSNSAPASASPTCFIRAINSTCDVDHKNMLANRDGIIINGALYSDESEWEAPNPALATQAGAPALQPTVISEAASSTDGETRSTASPDSSPTVSGQSSSTTRSLPTGVFTATGIPSVTSSSSDGSAAATAEARLSRPRHLAVAVMLGCLGSVALQ